MRKRVRFTFELVPGYDDDLIAWLESNQPKQRSAAVRDRLRSAIGPRSPDGLAAIRADLVEIREMIARATIQSSTIAPKLEGGPRLTGEQMQARAAKLKATQW